VSPPSPLSHARAAAPAAAAAAANSRFAGLSCGGKIMAEYVHSCRAVQPFYGRSLTLADL
jgi:hypothetical protein